MFPKSLDISSSTSLKEKAISRGRKSVLKSARRKEFFFFFIKRQSKFATRASRNELIVPLISFISLINPSLPGACRCEKRSITNRTGLSRGLEITLVLLSLHLVQMSNFPFLVSYLFNARISHL